MHRRYKKFLTLSQERLSKLIDLKSYEEIVEYNSREECKENNPNVFSIISEKQEFTSLYNLFSESAEFSCTVYKHKKHDSYLVHTVESNSDQTRIRLLYLKTLSSSLDLNKAKQPCYIDMYKSKYEETIALQYYYNAENIKYVRYINWKISCIRNYSKNTLKVFTFGNTGISYNIITPTIEYTNNRNNLYAYIHTEYKQSKTIIEVKFLSFSKIINFFKEGQLHRMNGPSIIRFENNVVVGKWWGINGKALPQDVFHYEKGLEQDITTTDILNGILFDREYGQFLKDKYHEQND